MAYTQVIDYLYNHLPQFSKQGRAAIKTDLTNIRILCEALGNPQEKFKSIHIAGTNGKGSVSHALSAIHQECGYKTGLYTSPHLIDFRERIRLNDALISKDFVVDFVTQHRALFDEVKPSFFEVTVAMAFDFFAKQEVDIAIIETGLGGRLDSTNIITPILSIITNISLDHMDVLGENLEAIAREKAGIIKQGVPVLTGEKSQETERIFFESALQKEATLYHAESMWELVKIGVDKGFQAFKAVQPAQKKIHSFKTDLLGNYQRKNLKTILAACELLPLVSPLDIPLEKAFKALGKVQELSGLRGRWEVLQNVPRIIADVAHNEAGIEDVLTQFAEMEASQKHVVLGFVKDKDVEKVLSLFPADYHFYFCNAAIPRALPANDLKEIAAAKGIAGSAFKSVDEAVQNAMGAMDTGDALLITGSFFIVGEAIAFLEKKELSKN